MWNQYQSNFSDKKNIICIKFAKTKHLVLMKKEQYYDKMNELIHDNQVYKSVREPRGLILHKKLNEYVNK